tara:strand:+ start:2112 stop:3275 length:1164 start_codon:yes stop_codon:yes gene_type:complete
MLSTTVPGAYNPINAMRNSNTLLEMVGHLPGAFITLAGAGFGAKKAGGVALRKTFGEVATRTIDPYHYSSKIGDVKSAIKEGTFIKRMIEPYDPKSIYSAPLKDPEIPYYTTPARSFAFRKMFGLKSSDEAENLFTEIVPDKVYSFNMKNSTSRHMALDVLNPRGFQLGRGSTPPYRLFTAHSLFGNYTKAIKPKLVNGKPTLETKYEDTWDWNWNKGELKNELARIFELTKSLPDRSSPNPIPFLRDNISYVIQRGTANMIAKPITFKGKISGKEYMNLLGWKGGYGTGSLTPNVQDFASLKSELIGPKKAEALTLTRYVKNLSDNLLSSGSDGFSLITKPSEIWWKEYDKLLSKIPQTMLDRLLKKHPHINIQKGTKNSAGQVIR